MIQEASEDITKRRNYIPSPKISFKERKHLERPRKW